MSSGGNHNTVATVYKSRMDMNEITNKKALTVDSADASTLHQGRSLRHWQKVITNGNGESLNSVDQRRFWKQQRRPPVHMIKPNITTIGK